VRCQVDKIFDWVGLHSYGEQLTGSQSSANSTPGIQPSIHVEPSTLEHHQQHTKPLSFAFRSSAASLVKDSASTAAPSKGPVDPDFINKITALYHTFVQPPHPSVPTPPQPTAWNLTMSLHKWLTPVPKLLVNGSHFQTWKRMLQQALQSVFARRLDISDTNSTPPSTASSPTSRLNSKYSITHTHPLRSLPHSQIKINHLIHMLYNLCVCVCSFIPNYCHQHHVLMRASWANTYQD
jgi:hypothetical protein